MICSLSKWLISNSLDTRRKIPSLVRRHISRCPSCQDFVQFSQMLTDKSPSDALDIIKESPDSIQEKIKPLTIRAADTKKLPWTRRWLIPVVATTIAASLIFVFFLSRPYQILFPESNQNLFQILGSSSLSGKSLQNLAVQVESPYDKEWLGLKNSIKSAAEHLTSHLDFKIDFPQK